MGRERLQRREPRGSRLRLSMGRRASSWENIQEKEEEGTQHEHVKHVQGILWPEPQVGRRWVDGLTARPGQLGESLECQPRAWTSVHGAAASYVNLMRLQNSPLTSVHAQRLAPTSRLLGDPLKFSHEPQTPQEMKLVPGPRGACEGL